MGSGLNNDNNPGAGELADKYIPEFASAHKILIVSFDFVKQNKQLRIATNPQTYARSSIVDIMFHVNDGIMNFLQPTASIVITSCKLH